MIELGTPVPEVDVFDGKGAAPLPVFFDGPALLAFFRADCRRCEGVLGLVAGIGRIAKGLTVIGVSQETIEATAEFMNSIGVRMPVVIDDRPYPASSAFGFENVPAIALIENDRISWTSDGAGTSDIDELSGLLAPWTKATPLALVSDYADAAPAPSRHLSD
ncbi:MAG: redoxin domain-containing protein [Acidimicrobiia bacterium]|nr:redoxin domain-containing protein [Acidimicrobiia bacterium]